MTENAINILLVEDDDVDRLRIIRALRKKNFDNPIHTAADGSEALELLRGKNGREGLPSPFLILLDLNMPCMGGIEFLETIRRDDDLKRSVVFVLTTSNDDRDKVAASDHNVAGYLLKSDIGNGFVEIVTMLEKFVVTVQFPPE